MAMPMISELTEFLWKTLEEPEKTALAERTEDLLVLRSRRETLKRFKKSWDGRGDWNLAFLAWLPTDQAGDRGPDQVPIGTQLARAIHAIGGDKIAAVYTKKTGKDCGCSRREKTLNKLDQKVRSAIKGKLRRV